MALVRAYGWKALWFTVRGLILGASLAAVAPGEVVAAGCDCDDGGSGHYSCASGNASSCSPGGQSCSVQCTEI